ncbi:hypothetical protein A5886_001744 [Enterococcus sp. 8G7_MSG3316]|uniref:Uncharacterized protein n=1 Tax=Candidatus Enterococcus testudinis TaxID=1834191 RepID=A0A242A6J9_9ENTE|nr:hypothetical protein [Enterococcus sp. 8G7_MSG3316]OTN76666.1 hypothetical protein A5886_001744 [Enterococcus sp. 8G7_MSG3316]
MNIVQVFKIFLLNLYTILLIAMFLSVKEQRLTFLSIIFFIVLNISISALITLANKKVLQIKYIVGLSRRKIMNYLYWIDGLSIVASLTLVGGCIVLFRMPREILLYLGYTTIIVFVLKAIVMKIIVGRFL